jgi:hypothetical protein
MFGEMDDLFARDAGEPPSAIATLPAYGMLNPCAIGIVHYTAGPGRVTDRRRNHGR